jgi:thioredoxin reductase
MSDLLIIGAGPIGLAAGIEAKRAGLQFQILEAGTDLPVAGGVPDWHALLLAR